MSLIRNKVLYFADLESVRETLRFWTMMEKSLPRFLDHAVSSDVVRK